MAPYELLEAGGALDFDEDNGDLGHRLARRLEDHFDRAVWLNPEPDRVLDGNTIEYIRQSSRCSR